MLEVSNLHSAYGRIEVLRGVSLEVRAGEIVALIGSNGAGKTTLLRALSGVQPITKGEIRFRGERVDRLPPHRRVELGVTQSPEGRQVFGPLSVADNLRLGAYMRRDKDIENDRDRIFEMFPVLREKRFQAAGGLSGGQQQMLAIGRALMGKPRLLLIAARLKRTRWMAQLYVGKRPISKGIGGLYRGLWCPLHPGLSHRTGSLGRFHPRNDENMPPHPFTSNCLLR